MNENLDLSRRVVLLTLKFNDKFIKISTHTRHAIMMGFDTVSGHSGMRPIVKY